MNSSEAETLKRQVTLKCVTELIEAENFDDDVVSDYEKGTLPKIKVISLSNDWKLRLLVYGPCPCCKSTHIRNICNVSYVKHCVAGIVLRKFPLIKEVNCALTHDDDFDDVVNRLGGNIEITVEKDDVSTFYEFKCFFLDKHPDVDAYGKFMHQRIYKKKDDMQNSTLVSWEMVNRKYICSWLVDEHTVMLSADGDLLNGGQILREKNRWLKKFEAGTMQDGTSIVVMLESTNSIRTLDYKQVTF